VRGLVTEEEFEKIMYDIAHQEIRPIMNKHEAALARNGTGFYVGDKVTCQ